MVEPRKLSQGRCLEELSCKAVEDKALGGFSSLNVRKGGRKEEQNRKEGQNLWESPGVLLKTAKLCCLKDPIRRFLRQR